MTGKKILIGITGSIAAYKTILLVRSLIKAGATVKVIMTPAARDFVSPLTLSTLSKNPVHIDLFHESEWSNHVELGRWADLFLIAPLSCNTLAKMATGQCDNLLLATWLSATCPVMIAPAMDEDMWHHPSTRANLNKMKEWGVTTIPVEKGELASGLFGEGRMAEPENIHKHIEVFFSTNQSLSGKKALITAGPTYEALDPVRFIGNHSSGKMGWELAHELKNRGAEVHFILGPSNLPVLPGVNLIKVKSASEMYQAALNLFDEVDMAIMAAAVADFTPVEVAEQKIKKTGDRLVIELQKTPDILKSLGEKKKNQLLVGFALETENEKTNALGKLKSKNADWIVLNSLQDAGAGFGTDTNKVTLFDKKGREFSFPVKSKQEVARDILNTITSEDHA